MKIDRHNYEEFFLLYVDRELSADQTKQVELFVRDNPDLEEELLMLEQSKLKPDDSVVFDNKDLLMRDENGAFINLDNYEEWLVLYVDDELTKEERLAVENFTSTHRGIEKELLLFQQTRLEPEPVLFPNKEILYRKEGAVVVSMQWWRVAVAAVLVIAAGLGLFSILYHQHNSSVVKNTAIRTNSKNSNGNSGSAGASNGTILPEKKEPASPANNDRPQMAVNAPGQKPANSRKPKQNNEGQLVRTNGPVWRAPIASQADANNFRETDVTVATVTPDKIHKNIFVDTTVTKTALHTPDIYKIPEVDVPIASSENRKLRGFFRKTSRIIARNAADDDNKLLIGGMAINVR